MRCRVVHRSLVSHQVALAAQQDANGQLAEESAELAEALANQRDAAEQAKAKAENQHAELTEQKLRNAHLEELVNSSNENLAMRADQVAGMQRSIAVLQERLDAKTEAEAAANRTNTEIQADVEVLQQKLADAQAKNAELEAQVSKETANGIRLEEAIQASEEDHAKEAETVKRTILALQRALMDKVGVRVRACVCVYVLLHCTVMMMRRRRRIVCLLLV